MKAHTKTYMDHMGYRVAEDCICEICGLPANDIHHIYARGMGGNPKKDKDAITNLMALCRKDHERYGDVPGYKTWLKEIHLKFIGQ